MHLKSQLPTKYVTCKKKKVRMIGGYSDMIQSVQSLLLLKHQDMKRLWIMRFINNSKDQQPLSACKY